MGISESMWDCPQDTRETVSLKPLANQWFERQSKQDEPWEINETAPQVNRPTLIIAVIHPCQPWSLGDWSAYRDERAAIREHDGGADRLDAERWAYLDCVAMWMSRHPPISMVEELWTGTATDFRLCRVRDACFVLELLGIKPPQGGEKSPL